MKGKQRAGLTKVNKRNQIAFEFSVSRFTQTSHQALTPEWVHATLKIFKREALKDLV